MLVEQKPVFATRASFRVADAATVRRRWGEHFLLLADGLRRGQPNRAAQSVRQ
jgi:hypothetical protein